MISTSSNLSGSGTYICDNGTGFLKLGCPGQSFPQAKIPSVIGRPMLRYDQVLDGIQIKSEMFGDQTVKARAMLELQYPISEGIVKNWDDMQRLWQYAFTQKLGIKDFGASKVMMTQAALNPIESRKKLAEVMLESFGFKGFQIGVQAIFALSAEGHQSGLVLDSGDGVTHCIPVYQGFLLRPQVRRINLAGRHVTDHLIKLLLLRGYAFNSTADFELVRELKETACYVSCNLPKDRKIANQTTALDKEYSLPDGSMIRIGRQRFEAAEIMFNPSVLGYEFDGVAEMIMNTIKDCDIDVRKCLYENIILSGGSTMYPGFPTRLQNQVAAMHKKYVSKGKSDKVKVKVKDSAFRKHGVFIGAGITAAVLDQSGEGWITKKQWEENGMNSFKMPFN